ncbi:MAG: glycogen-binding domain-containing protein, partial [Flavobacteriales bacterium]
MASTVSLPVESPAEINLADFILEMELLDSVSIKTPFSVTLTREGSFAQLTWNTEIPPISELKLWSDGIASSIILVRSKKEAVELTYSGEAESVQVAGEFTSWSSKNQDFEQEGSEWSKTIYLDPGLYQYQIVVDGTWIMDPANADSVDNNVGGFNSLLNVGNLDENGAPLILTKTSDQANVRFEFKNEPTEIFAVWENHLLPSEMVGLQGSELTVGLPILAQQAPNSTLRVWAYNENGVSNDIYVPLQNGKPILKHDEVKRTEWHSAQMYFMMVDRFING